MDKRIVRSPMGISLHPQMSTQETPYNLMHGIETMIPVEVGEPTVRRQMFDLTLNKESLSINLDLVNELREKIKIREATCKLWAARRYNTNVRLKSFQKEDLAWRMRIDVSKNEGKFSSNWEGPIRIREVVAGEAYHLEWLSSRTVPRTWNVAHLSSVDQE